MLRSDLKDNSQRKLYPCNDRPAQLTREVLFRKLLARFGWLADFLSNEFPLIILILLDGVEKVLFLEPILLVTSVEGNGVSKSYLILGELSVVHILVPMLLYTAFCACWEFLFLISISAENIIGFEFNQPWQSQPSCSRHRAFVSAGALRWVSMVCLSDSSSPGG